MNRQVVIQYQVRPESADENQRLLEQVIAQLASEQPEALRFTTFRLDDGVSFIAVIESDSEPSPLVQLSTFQEFLRNFEDRVAVPPVTQKFTVIGSYRLLEE